MSETAQIELGNAYWNVLIVQAFFLGFLLFIVKIAIVFGKPGKDHGLKFSGIVVFTAFVWGLSVSILFLFGGIDWLYYELRPEVETPNTLPWLNNHGIFDLTQKAGQDPNMVEKVDLHLSVVLGFATIIGIWLILIYKTRKLDSKIRKMRL